MKSPVIPVNEAKRLLALRESGLLDIDVSPTLDRLTRLAKRFFQVPLAMVNLIDEHSLIVKSADGQAPGSVPRNISFCGHTILTEAPLVVGDMLQDDRFADNPLVAGEPRVRFYAGFPLRLRDGLAEAGGGEAVEGGRTVEADAPLTGARRGGTGRGSHARGAARQAEDHGARVLRQRVHRAADGRLP